MAKKNLLKNRKVISAMCIGISAMMAMTPITAHAEELDVIPGDDSQNGDVQKSGNISETEHNNNVEEYEHAKSEEFELVRQKEDNTTTVTEETRTEGSSSLINTEFIDNTVQDDLLDAVRDNSAYTDEEGHEAYVSVDSSLADSETEKILEETGYETGEKQGIVNVDSTEDYIEVTTNKVNVERGEISWGEESLTEVFDEEGNLIGWTSTINGECSVTVSSEEKTEKEYNDVVTKTTTTLAPSPETGISPDEFAKKLTELGVEVDKKTGEYKSTKDGVSVSKDENGLLVITVVTTKTEDRQDGDIVTDGVITREQVVEKTENIVVDQLTGTITTTTTTTTTIQPKTIKQTYSFGVDEGNRESIKNANDEKHASISSEIESISDVKMQEKLQEKVDALFKELENQPDEQVTNVELQQGEKITTVQLS